MYERLAAYIGAVQKEVNNIAENRKKELRKISIYIRARLEAGETAKLTFICTHNSRRSHFCQIWAATVASHIGIGQIRTFSGGTEATAFNPRALAAIERAGFRIENPGDDNPHYQVYFAQDAEPLICFSKTFDDPCNPQEHFAAIMTCSDADENCPFIPGASMRVSIPYIDPKKADDTPLEAQTYDERCRQIATEMYYMISQLSQ